jgi:integrase
MPKLPKKKINIYADAQCQRILKAGVKTGTFHDIRRTVISMWFANGMSEYEVMRLEGHSDFATTHKFYLAVADGLVDRARQATSQAIGKICCKSVASTFEPKKALTVPIGTSCDIKSYD